MLQAITHAVGTFHDVSLQVRCIQGGYHLTRNR
jgi:hypothetical protein